MSDTYTLAEPSAYTRRPPVVPLRLTERGRVEMLTTHPELLASGEVCQTTDELRLWRGDTLLGPVVDHGTFPTEEALAAWYLSPSCTRGVHVGDTAYVTAAGCAYNVASGHASTATWRRSATAGDPAGTAASAVSAHDTSETAHADLRTSLAGKWATPANASALGDISRAEDNAPLWRGSAWPGGSGGGGIEVVAPADYPSANTTLTWVSNGDANGLMSYLGSDGNPHTLGRLVSVLNYSTVSGSPGGAPLAEVVGRTFSSLRFLSGTNDYPFIGCDLGSGCSLLCDKFTLWRCNEGGSWTLNGWALQGSNDCASATVVAFKTATWTTLFTKSGAYSPDTTGVYRTETPSVIATAYRFFRLISNSYAGSGGASGYLPICSWDLYGSYTGRLNPPSWATGWGVSAGLYVPIVEV